MVAAVAFALLTSYFMFVELGVQKAWASVMCPVTDCNAFASAGDKANVADVDKAKAHNLVALSSIRPVFAKIKIGSKNLKKKFDVQDDWPVYVKSLSAKKISFKALKGWKITKVIASYKYKSKGKMRYKDYKVRNNMKLKKGTYTIHFVFKNKKTGKIEERSLSEYEDYMLYS